jgi:F420-dependent oxidoreductase-like protein
VQVFEGQVRFGIHRGPQYTTFDEELALWRRVEELGYDWASVFDHFLPIYADPQGPCLEGPTLLSALAARTSRIRCAILVVGNTYRHPAVLASIATTIDHVSGGRLELGVGAGWFETEHRQYGIPFPPTGTRIRMLGESLTILKSLWTKQRTTFEGRWYQVRDASCEPKPVQRPHMPLWVGGAGEQLTLRVVAESADGWNTFLLPPEDYRHKLEVLAEHCKAVGRDPADIRKSLVFRAVVREHQAEAERSPAAAALRQRDPNALVGTPERVAAALEPLLELGVGDFLLGATGAVDPETVELVARRVAPELRAVR